jgi:clan AA aspartic protease
MKRMGLFRVAAHLAGPTGRAETVDVLVDTGATFLVVPRDLAARLELRATRTCPIETAGGREEMWPLAEVRIRLETHEVTTPCLIAPQGAALLGAVALESLLLAADPVARRLVPVKGFVGELTVA